MTISSTVRKAGPFDGTGSQTEFPFEFKVFSAGDLYVVQYNEVISVETVLELDSDYTVTLNADQDNDPGGTIELTSALAVNYTLTITSSLANLQPTDLTNRGGFYPSVINDALDRACIQIQQLQDETDRTLKTAVSVPDGVDNTLPMPAANMVIGWDNTGVALKNWSVNDLVTSVAYGSAKADIFTGDGETVDFYLELDPASINNLDVSVGGVCQVPVDDYTWTSGTKVTFTTAPPDGETVLIRYMQALPQGTVVWTSVYGRPFVDDVVYITQDTTITTAVNVLEGGMFIISSGKTLTINGPFSCGSFHCFSGEGDVAFGDLVEYVTPSWFAISDTFPYATSAVQKAFDSNRPVKFTESYTVDNVVIDGSYKTIDFNGFWLTGGAEYTPDYVLAIKCMYSTLYNIKVNQNFKRYTSAVRWFSETGVPAFFNKIYGMHITNAIHGLTYGQSIGTPSTDASQSENTLYSYTVRAVKVPFTGNQSNGWLTMIAPILDCAPSEWTSQPGFDSTEWGINSRCFDNRVGTLTIFGGELLKTTSQLGYGLYGESVAIVGACLEIACCQAYVTGKFSIRDASNCYQASDSQSVIEFSNDADDVLVLDNVPFYRGAGVHLYSGQNFFAGGADATIKVFITNCIFTEWATDRLVDSSASHLQISMTNVRFPTGGPKVMDFREVGDVVVSANHITPSGKIFHMSGTAVVDSIYPPYSGWTGSITIIPDGVFTTVTAGHIAKATTAVVGQALTMTYDGTKWYPSY